MNDRIQSVVALRALAFLGIFLLHVGCPISWSNFGVATFFVLSGFLLSYRHNDIEMGGKECIKFAAQHVKKIYPLHIITMLMVLFFTVAEQIQSNGLAVREIGKLGFQIILNIFLMQSWFPSVTYNISFNGVAWFLSSIFFCYFMFPKIQLWLKKKDKHVLGLVVITVILFQLVITAILVWLNVKEDLFRWATYDAPFFRLADFIVGMVAGTIVTHEKIDRPRDSKGLIIVVLLIGLIANIWETYGAHENFISKIFNNYTTIYIPISAIVIVLLSIENTFLANNKMLMFIGNNSNYYYLIHYAVIKTIRIVMRMNGIESKDHWLIIMIAVAGITVFFAELYKKAIVVFNNIRMRSL